MTSGNNDATEPVEEEATDSANNSPESDKPETHNPSAKATDGNGASSADSESVFGSDANPNHAESDQSGSAEVAEDPLGFGDHRMDTESPNDAETSEQSDDEITQLQLRLDQAEAKASEHWDRLLRLQAEMENQRKRAQNDVNKARKFALESIVSDLLPVKDSLEMGLAAATADDADVKSIVEGAELTLKMLAQVFEKNNILEVNPVDEKFDPEFHQAMSMQEVEGKEPNSITSVMQKGYTLNDRLVRPALVMVAK